MRKKKISETKKKPKIINQFLVDYKKGKHNESDKKEKINK